MLGSHSMPNDDRQAAQQRLADLITLARSLPPSGDLSRLIDEADALSRAIAASVSLNAEYGDSEFTDYYYSITPAGSLASGLPVFKASSGFTDVGARVLLGYDLDGNLANGGVALVVAGSYSHLLGDAKRSPVVSIRGSADQWIGAVGIGYTF